MVAKKKTKFNEVRTCPLCGCPWKHDAVSLFQHLKSTHENDLSALAWHLARALRLLLNRRKGSG